jgi:hypothetical protein
MSSLAFTLTALGLLALAFIPLTALADAIHNHTYKGNR